MTLPHFAGLLRWWARRRNLPFALRDRVLRRLADPDSMPPTPFETEFFGLRYGGDLSSFIDWTVFFYGAYEPALLAFLGETAWRLAGPQAIVLDIGANVGQHSLYLARTVAQVHAFEPWEPVRQALANNLARNDITNVAAHAIALSDSPGEAIFYAPTAANRGTGSFVAGHDLSNRPAGRLALKRGDDVVGDLGLARLDLIKVDTEGFEERVLAGLAQTLRRYRPVVVFELSPSAGEGFSRAGGVETRLGQIFGPDWQLWRLAGSPERLRLLPFSAEADGGTVVAAPAEKARLLPHPA